jgi:hypothetical protein
MLAHSIYCQKIIVVLKEIPRTVQIKCQPIKVLNHKSAVFSIKFFCISIALGRIICYSITLLVKPLALF